MCDHVRFFTDTGLRRIEECPFADDERPVLRDIIAVTKRVFDT